MWARGEHVCIEQENGENQREGKTGCNEKNVTKKIPPSAATTAASPWLSAPPNSPKFVH